LFLFLKAHEARAALGESRKEVHARYQTIVFGERQTTTKKSFAAEFRFRGFVVKVIYVGDQSVDETFSEIPSEENALKLLRELHPDAEWKEDRHDPQRTTWKAGVFTATYAERKLRLVINGVETGR
jgi:hypothetical protein